jgi:mono/diheme cytochrome c family protein
MDHRWPAGQWRRSAGGGTATTRLCDGAAAGARALGHCGECHTPRNSLGMMQQAQEFQGSEIVGVDVSPTGLAEWTSDDFLGLLQIGMTAEFDFVGGEMAEVVEHTSLLSQEDQDAYAAFFTRKSE